MESQPLDVFHDGIHIFSVFLDGIGIIETQIADPAKLFSRTKIDTDGFGMPDVQIPVGLGRETGLYVVKTAGAQVFFYRLVDKITRCSGWIIGHFTYS